MIDPTFDPRVAGQVTRYHSWPRLREQSVAEHTWQVMRILMTVWPDAPCKIIKHAMFHDVGEMYGDIQWPWKLRVPELGVGAKKAEAEVHSFMTELWDLPPPVTLSQYEHDVFKICENLEMWEWALFELNLGNKFAVVVAKRMMAAVSNGLSVIDKPQNGYPDLRPAITRYIQKRSVAND
jgi:HD domain